MRHARGDLDTVGGNELALMRGQRLDAQDRIQRQRADTQEPDRSCSWQRYCTGLILPSGMKPSEALPLIDFQRHRRLVAEHGQSRRSLVRSRSSARVWRRPRMAATAFGSLSLIIRSASIRPSASTDTGPETVMRAVPDDRSSLRMSTAWPRRLFGCVLDQRQAVLQRHVAAAVERRQHASADRIGVDLEIGEAADIVEVLAVRLQLARRLAGTEQLDRIGVVSRIGLAGQAVGLQRYAPRQRPRQFDVGLQIVPVDPQRRHAGDRGPERPAQIGDRRQGLGDLGDGIEAAGRGGDVPGIVLIGKVVAGDGEAQADSR